ncbi:MAG TPA: mechanosensitive ion channel family protein [Candidatus Tectomicrobia bacterium]|nr:mechanosensitive ion channel family protein [Candidatus Tectomicrobia bacterium]
MEGSVAELLRAWGLSAPLAALLGRVLAVALVVVVLYGGYRMLVRLAARLTRPDGALPAARARTLAMLLVSAGRWIFGFALVLVLLRELGVDVQALLLSAGIVGVAVGFGAQALVRDVITGIFVLVEGLVHVGDTIQVGPHVGTVESIGLRITTLRMVDGALRVVPNAQLTEFTSYSAGWARAVVDVAVPRDVPVESALATLREVGEAWARDTGEALDRPEAQGIMRFSGGDMVLRLLVKVAPARRVDAELELRRRIKAAFERHQWSALGA